MSTSINDLSRLLESSRFWISEWRSCKVRSESKRINPDAETIEVLVLDDGAYTSLGVFYGRSILPSRIVPDMPVKVEQFFVKVS